MTTAKLSFSQFPSESIIFSATDVNRFMERLGKQDKDGCLPWRGGTFNHGYGCIFSSTKKKYLLTHRFAYMLFHGLELDSKSVVCHGCHNKICCNPDHLFWGTQSDNVLDTWANGNGVHQIIRGMDCKTSKLTDNEVREIRRIYSIGELSQSEIGRMFNVTQTTIGSIVRRDRWTHIK